MRHFTAAEADTHLDAVAILEELLRIFHLDVEIVGVDVGRHANGYVYAVLDTRRKQETERYIVKLKGKDAEFVIQEVGEVSAESYSCCGIGSGINDDFLIYASNLDCAKGYSYGKETNNNVGEISDEIKSNASGARCIFLDDGRMLLVTRFGQVQEEQIVMMPNNTMYYIPMK